MRQALRDAAVEAAREAGAAIRGFYKDSYTVREKGVDVIVPGEMPMNLLLANAGVHHIGSATVIDGIATCFKMAETLHDLKQISGMTPSQVGFFHAKPDAQRVEDVLKFYGLENLGRRIQED